MLLYIVTNLRGKILLLGLGWFYRIIAPHVEGSYVIEALGKEARAIIGFELRH